MIPRTELDRYYRARFADKTAQLRGEYQAYVDRCNRITDRDIEENEIRRARELTPGHSPAAAPAPVGDAIARLERADLASPTELDFMLTAGMLV